MENGKVTLDPDTQVHTGKKRSLKNALTAQGDDVKTRDADDPIPK